MRRNNLFVLFLLILTLLFPSICIIAKFLHYSFTVKNGIVYAIASSVLYYGIGILLIYRKERRIGKTSSFFLSVSLLLNQINTFLFIFHADNQAAMLLIALWFVMTAILVAVYVKSVALMTTFYALSGILVLPISLFIMLSDFGARTVIAREVSPDMRYCAEVIDDDQGALGGATILMVYKLDGSFSIGSFEFRKDEKIIHSGSWGEYEELYWNDEEHLTMNNRSYSMVDFFPRGDHAERDMIFTYVREHEGVLLDCIEKEDFSSVENDALIRKISVSDDCIDFLCGGDGFGSETAYWGFYYSEKDDMTALWCAHPADQRLERSGEGYLWKEAWYDPRGDNTYYTEWICGHFYYYEMSF
ncbi:MAG: hypothetical protein IJK63_10955 [Oscillospiraceae bacterium]|nr:hypothetical protein [Oscillospiraceae bacterium]